MTNLHHFYHIYCDGSWKTPAQDHFRSLKKYNLIDNLSTLHVGIVGNQRKRKEVKDFLNSQDIVYNVCTEVDSGWEQETLDKLYDFSQNNDGYVFYAHTKTAVNASELHTRWRLSMTYFNVVQWKECVEHLDNNISAVGCHYLKAQYENIKELSGFFAGTYWWTHLKYIRNLPAPERTTRYDAEVWIRFLKQSVENYGDKFEIYDMNPGWPHLCYLKTNWDYS